MPGGRLGRRRLRRLLGVVRSATAPVTADGEARSHRAWRLRHRGALGGAADSWWSMGGRRPGRSRRERRDGSGDVGCVCVACGVMEQLHGYVRAVCALVVVDVQQCLFTRRPSRLAQYGPPLRSAEMGYPHA